VGSKGWRGKGGLGGRGETDSRPVVGSEQRIGLLNPLMMRSIPGKISKISPDGGGVCRYYPILCPFYRRVASTALPLYHNRRNDRFRWGGGVVGVKEKSEQANVTPKSL
jgi:hypothetical protein